MSRRPGVKLFETPAAFAERLGHPAWIVERWVTAYGRAAALRICEADQREPGAAEMFVIEGGAPGDGEGVGGDDAADAEFADTPAMSGGVPVMDDGSRLVAELAAAAMPGAGRVWDCCAAPGGKTIVLARRLEEAEILASDVSAKRLKAMEARMGALAASAGDGGRVRCVTADAEGLSASEGMFDLVLCDVPCSGTGTLARNPEIRHRLVPEEMGRQAERQKRILAAAMGRVAEGGRLVYSTCSLEPEECERVVEAVAGEWRGLMWAD